MAQTLTRIERQRVDLADLSGSMAALWAQIEASDPTPLSRALTMNFIGVTRVDREAELDEAIERLLLRHPCRSFVVVFDDDVGEVDAELGAAIRHQKRARQTVLEQIRLRAPTRSFAAVPGLIRPLVVNDIPVHLFWAAALPADVRDLTTMARLADQTVVDSCRFADPAADLRRISEIEELRVLDLAHFRLRPWRRALAEAFEVVPWDAEQPTGVTLWHGPECGALAAAHTLAAWLAERLGAACELRTAEGRAPDAEPARLELTHQLAHVLVEHAVSAPSLSTTVSLRDRCLLPFQTSATRGRLGDLLGAAVDGLA